MLEANLIVLEERLNALMNGLEAEATENDYTAINVMKFVDNEPVFLDKMAEEPDFAPQGFDIQDQGKIQEGEVQEYQAKLDKLESEETERITNIINQTCDQMLKELKGEEKAKAARKVRSDKEIDKLLNLDQVKLLGLEHQPELETLIEVNASSYGQDRLDWSL